MSATALIERLSQRQGTTTVTTQRNTPSLDNTGSPVDSWSNNLTSVKAVVQLTAGSEGVRYGRENNRSFGKAFIAPGQDVLKGDRLTFSSRTFDVQDVRTPGEMGSSDVIGYMVLDIEETAT